MLHNRRTLLLLGASLALTLTVGACSGGGGGGGAGGVGADQTTDGTVSVVATTSVYADVAQAIGGEYVRVHAIISSANADPHGYEANAQDKLAVSKAQIGIENGGGYDDFFPQLAKGQLDAENIINVSELSGLDSGADFNEHVWYSLPTMSKLADQLVQRFSAALPAEAASFATHADEFKAQLKELQTRLIDVKKAYSGTAVAITEPVPMYLLEEAGLVNTTPAKFTEAVENGADVPAATVAEVLSLIASGKIALLAYNQQTEGPQTSQIKTACEAAGIPVVNFAETLPENTHYVNWMLANVSHLEQGLKTMDAK
ncbi:zinc ABC transporter substrate-binding protein [Arthrobacter sp. TMP15]|uniref:metal ABC transporter solute-binding protein, Zn/Mn family n=1 Tax=Arthrobacter sp. TMP15 TaxID=3140789 RepID=UPI0031B9E3E5